MLNQNLLEPRDGRIRGAMLHLAWTMAIALLLLLPASARADVYVVVNPGDPYATGQRDNCVGQRASTYCSLRDAVEAAYWTPGDDTIILKAGDYKLNRRIEISGGVTIQGATAADPAPRVIWGPCRSNDLMPPGSCGGATLPSGGLFGVIYVPLPPTNWDFAHCFTQGGPRVVSISGVTIRGGAAAPAASSANAELAIDQAGGGGIRNLGCLKLTDVTVMRNTALAGAGGIANDGGNLWLENSTVRENVSAWGPTGGIANGPVLRYANPSHSTIPWVSRMTIKNSTISGNNVVGGANHGSTGSYNGYAGGIINTGKLDVISSVVTDNQLANGQYDSPADTDSHSSAGGILNLGDQGVALGSGSQSDLALLHLTAVLVAGNDGGTSTLRGALPVWNNADGVYSMDGQFFMSGSTIAGNYQKAPGGFYSNNDCYGWLISQGGNMIGRMGIHSGQNCRITDATDKTGYDTNVDSFSPDFRRQNAAFSGYGSRASASSTYHPLFPASAVIDGNRVGPWGNSGGWNDGTSGSFPDWLRVDFGSPSTIAEVDLFTLQNDYTHPVAPQPWTTFSLYGMTDFQVQYLDSNNVWRDLPGGNGNVHGNNLVWRRITFAPVTTSAIRVVVSGAIGPYSRIIEVEAYGIGLY